MMVWNKGRLTKWKLRHMIDLFKKLNAAKEDKEKKKLLEKLDIDWYSFDEMLDVVRVLAERLDKANERVKAAQEKKRSNEQT